MTDNLSKEMRSKLMSSIRGKNTKPELTVRKMLWSKGFRYRIHDKSVCGTPDISNKKKKLAIFVDGCFWHGCKICYKEPKTNSEFWRKKIQDNKKRRSIVKKRLRSEGWKLIEIWGHEVSKHPNKIGEKIEMLNKGSLTKGKPQQ